MRLIYSLLLPLLLGGLLTVGCTPSGPPAVVTLPPEQDLAPNLRILVDRTVKEAQSDPSNPARHGKLGMVYEANGLNDAAARSYANAEQLEPDNPSWPLHRAICRFASGDVEFARTLLNKVLAKQNNFAPAWYWLGSVEIKRGEIDAAMQAFVNAQRFAPEAVPARVGIADCLIRQKDYQGAVDRLKSIVAQTKGYGHAHFLLGMAYRGLGKKQLAMRHLQRGLDSQPIPLDDPVSVEVRKYGQGIAAIIDKAITALETDPARAQQILENGRKLFPKEVSLLNNLATTYSLAGNHAKAMEVLAEALEYEPLNYRTHVNKSLFCRRQGKLRDALEAANEAIRVAPQVADGYIEKARILIEGQDRKSAAAPLQQAALLVPSNAWVNEQLGVSYELAGDWKQAAQHYQKALPETRRREAVMVALARACAEAGDVTRARNLLGRIQKNWPQNPGIPGIVDAIRRKAEQQ